MPRSSGPVCDERRGKPPVCPYTEQEPQLPDEQPPQEEPPPTGLSTPSSPLAKEATRDIRRLPLLEQRGQMAGSSAWAMALRTSKPCPQLVQLYS